jgi:S-disulfanyl-L-cysteine oxidoreductase SoxD
MCKARSLALVSVLLVNPIFAAEPGLQPSKPVLGEEIGRLATQSELRALDISVLPDGMGLPVGRGTAKEGKAVYDAQCAACHGFKGEGLGDYAALVGGRGSLGTSKPTLTVGSYWPYATTLWDYIRRAMPYQAPGSLKSNDIYAVTAWLLYANGIISQGTVIDRQSLPTVRMPNRNGFVADPRPDVKPIE